MKRSFLKRSIALLLTVVLLCGTFGTIASAASITIKEFYSETTMTLCSPNTKKAVSSYGLYGNADYIGLKIVSTTQYEDRCVFQLASDSGFKKTIASYSNSYKKGTSYDTLTISLKGLKSGTYYARTYVEKRQTYYSYYPSLVIDKSTYKTYKITIKRGGTSIKKTNSVMYAYENTTKGPQIYWFAVPNAKGYYVYKYVDKKYKKIATVKATKDAYCSFIDKSVTKNSTQTYRVAAYNSDGSGYISLNKCVVKYITAPKVSVSCYTDSRMKVSWTAPAKGLTYYVYRYNEASSSWDKIATTKGTSYYDAKLTSGNYYYYTVVGENSSTTTAYNENGVGKLYLAAPAVTTSVTDTTIDVKWNAVAGATSYRVYKKAYNDTSWTYLKTVGSECTYSDTAFNKGTAYFYTVKAMAGSIAGSYSSRGVFTNNIDTPVINDIKLDENESPIISWSDCGPDVTYRIYEKAEAGWNRFADTPQNSYTAKKQTLSVIKTFTYTVRAFSKYNSKTYSGYDAAGKSYIYYPQLKNTAFTVEGDGVHLSWDSVNADSYNIYRSTFGGDYELITSTTETSYCDATAEPDTAYLYKIVYTHNSVEIANKSAEISVYINNKEASFNIVENTASNSGYSAVINNYNVGDIARLYKKVDGIWTLQATSTNGALFINEKSSCRAEYAVSVTSADEKTTVLPKDGYVITHFAKKLENAKGLYDSTQKSIQLTWDAVEFATSYSVYRKNLNDSKIEFLATTTESTYTVNDLKENDSYAYYIAATDGKFTSDFIYINKYTVFPEIEFTASNAGGAVKLKWTPDPALEYQSLYICRKVAGTDNWEKRYAGNYGEFYDNDVKSGTSYVYDIYYYNSADRICVDTVSFTHLGQPVMTKAANTATSTKIYWDKVEGATSYKVYKKIFANSIWSGWKCLNETTDTSYEDSTVKGGVKAKYTVIAFNDTTRSSYYTDFQTIFLSVPSLKSATASTSGIKLKFGAVTGANGYYVYRKTGSDGTWSKIAYLNGSTTSYTDKKAVKGTTYYYTVRAYASNFLTNGQISVGYFNTKGIACKMK